jgi:hypothetical protein
MLPPPYYDIGSGKISGIVQGIAISPSDCSECFNASLYFQSLSDPYVGIAFSNTTILEENSTAAQAMIAKYNITRLPALMLDPEVQAYLFFNKSIKSGGTLGDDGWYVLRSVPPPYVDLAANRSVRGFVDLAYIVNSSCTDCLDITSVSDYLDNSAGIYISDTKTYEVNSTEGMALVKKYNITRIPTLLYSPEASVYQSFAKAWVKQNNTIESDGWFVFRTVELAGDNYQNISAG